MQITPPYLAAAIAACATLSTTGANALTLGNLVVHSHLGEPLHAQIAVRTSADESVDETCLTLPRPANAPDSLPYLSRASFSVAHAPSGQVIHLRSTQIINDPVLKVLLQVSCSGQTSLSREFTLLLEPDNYASATPIASAMPIAEDETPQRISELPALKREPSRSKRSTATPATQSASPAASKKPARHYPATTESFQLKLSTGEIDLSASRNLTEEDRLKLREKQLLLEADDQVANIMALKNQVKQLESRLSEVSLKISTGMLTATPSPSPQLVPKTTLPAQPAKPLPTSGLGNFWFGLGLLGVLLGLFFAMRRYRRHNKALEQFAMEDEKTESPWAAPIPIPAGAKSTTEETYYDPSSIFTPPDEKITLTEMDSVVEEADLYLIYGWTDKAIDLLQGYIQKHPQEIQPWIMLFDIYRSQDKKEAFDKLAHRFKENFDDADQWRKVQTLGREFDPKNSLYFSAKQEAEDDFQAHSKTDFKPNIKE